MCVLRLLSLITTLRTAYTLYFVFRGSPNLNSKTKGEALESKVYPAPRPRLLFYPDTCFQTLYQKLTLLFVGPLPKAEGSLRILYTVVWGEMEHTL